MSVLSPDHRREQLDLANASIHRAQFFLLDMARFTGPQVEYLSIEEQFGLWRAGNQIGKSYALAADIVMCARGLHNYRTVKPAPVRIMVISYSEAQMKPLIWKIFQFLDKREIDPKLRCSEGAGLQGYKDRFIEFVAGPGKGSIIFFATYKAGTQAIAGFTGDYLFCDEPMPESVFGEIIARLFRAGGELRITMTPTPEAPPQLWLRDKIDEDRKKTEDSERLVEKEGGSPRRRRWRDQQTPICEEALTPTGGLINRPFKTQAEIDELLEEYLQDELHQRRDGAWEGVLSGRWLTNYGDKAQTDDNPVGRTWWAVGIDHGAKAGRERAVLVGYSEETDRAIICQEYASDGRTSTREDVQGILDMIDRQGLRWMDIDYWVGDRAHGGDLYGNSKSNGEMMLEFEFLLKLGKRELRRQGLRIYTPSKSNGSMRRGYRLVNSLFRTGQLVAHKRCEEFDSAGRTWCGKLQDPAKDILDAARYAIERLYDEKVLSPRGAGRGTLY